MTLQQITDFLAVAQHGSLHAAARASGQTQPALTKSLRRLESALGTPLFERHAKGVRPNDFGQRFLVHARRIAAEVQRARDAIDQSLGERRGRVAFGISAAASLLLAPAVIGRFRHEFPAVELRSHSGLYHGLAPLLREGQIDLMICPLPPEPVDLQFATRTLLDSEMLLVARRDHPLGRARSVRELEHAGFVIGGPRGQTGGGIYAVFERAGLGVPRVELQTDSLVDSAAMVVASDCLALLPAALMRSGLLRERLVPVPVADELPAYTVAMFQRSLVPLTPAADTLATLFEREAAQRRGE